MHGTVRGHLAAGQANPGSSLARGGHGGQPALGNAAPAGPYAFLRLAGLSPATLTIAEGEARRTGVAPHDVLLSSGYLSRPSYAAALASWLEVPLAGWDATVEVTEPFDLTDPDERPLQGRLDGRPCVFVCADAGSPVDVEQRIAMVRAHGLDVALSCRARLDAALDSASRSHRLDEAVEGLYRRDRASSAAETLWLRQVIVAAVLTGLVAGGAAVDLEATAAAVSAVIAIPFLCATLLRAAALREVIAGPARAVAQQPFRPEPFPPDLLPSYSVLVPLFREANVLPGLVQALQALVYPNAKLEILLILEAADLETQAALLRTRLPGNFRTVVVPEQAPQTKPKALNYGLQFARGDYIVVYDAEDRPEPDQLLRAVAAFHRLPADVGCLQAQLNVYNPRRSWVTRQFTIEYSALFDAILPALARLRLPVPLGGTSNHLRREALIQSGGWDPFNVTEDADLGFRLARRGWRTAVLASTTWEEAPVRLSQWFRQRTRWLKGWMQTYLVHTRRPWRLHAELGTRAALGLHAFMGALLLSAFVHPLFYLLLGYYALQGDLFSAPGTAVGSVLWAIACINLCAGYGMSILIGILSVCRRQNRDLAVSALWVPVTWLLISAAAYRALYQLVRDPYLWEKTEHGS